MEDMPSCLILRGLSHFITDEESKNYHEESLMWGNAEYHMSEMSTTADEQVLDLIRNVKESFYMYLTTGDRDQYFNSTSQLAHFL